MVWENYSKEIFEVIKDYRNHDGIFITPSDITKWAKQFDENGLLILRELSKIIKETYVSEEKAKQLLYQRIIYYQKLYNISDIDDFLKHTEFLNVQQAHKSQPAILSLLDNVLNDKFNKSYVEYTDYAKTIYIYLDDILASGSTIGRDIVEFLRKEDSFGQTNASKIENDKIKLSVGLFCLHTWGHQFQQYRIQKVFKEKVKRKINWNYDYEIQNHAKFNRQKLNIAKPIKGNNNKINAYLESLSATKYEDYAYRDIHTPAVENFFSSAENRILFENVLTEKGIDIINMIQGDIKPNLRPLGLINPQYKIFGLGTHFFTWRNIPNNAPLVYWWDVCGHDWVPLFPVANRGVNK